MNYELTDDDVNDLRAMLTWMRGSGGGGGLANSPGGLTIIAPQRRRKLPAVAVPASSSSAPQYQGMVNIGVAANTAGWALAFAVNALPTS